MKDVYQEITDRILGSLDSAGEWVRPWKMASAGMPINAVSKQRYRGSNVLMCWLSGMIAGYSSNRWATFKQWADMDVKIKKGEKGTPIIFFKQYEKQGDNGEPEQMFVARNSYVFNAEQTDEVREGGPETPSIGGVTERFVTIEEFVSKSGASVTVQGERAYYVPSLDRIFIPDMGLFKSSHYYYGTLLHELTHWTGAKSRMDRDLAPRFNEEAYAMEELVAELGAAFMCASFGIESTTRDDHASYIGSWIKVMRGDRKAIVTAASQAEKAVDYLNQLVTPMQEAA